jgi:hypothetical protein
MSRKYNEKHYHKNGRRTIRCLLPYETIEAAIDGDYTAINEIVEHFGSYILRLAGTDSYTSSGRNYFIVDKTKADTMKIALIEKSLSLSYCGSAETGGIFAVL